MPRDHRQPASERPLFTQRAESLPRRDEHVLHEIVHLSVRDAREENAVHHSPVEEVQLLERPLVARPCRPDDLAVIGAGGPLVGWQDGVSEQSDGSRHTRRLFHKTAGSARR
jgi:hypothetical protein